MPVKIIDAVLSKIIPTKENNRKVKNPKADAELKDDIERNGLLQPGVARPHPDKKDHFDLRIGARRYAACKALGWKTMPIQVQDMDDQMAMIVTLAENMKRKNLHPLDEARGLQSLLKKPETTLAKAAELLGLTRNTVAKRLKLLSLTKEWQKALFDTDHLAFRIPPEFLEEIARLPANEQESVLADFVNYSEDFLSCRDIKEFRFALKLVTHQLDGAPWPTDDEILNPKAGACSNCKKRTGADPALWDDISPESLAGPGHCLDPECFGVKLEEWLVNRQTQQAEKLDKAVHLFDTGTTRDADDVLSQRLRALTSNHFQWEKCGKKDEHSEPAIQVDGKKPGTAIWIRPININEDYGVEGAAAGVPKGTISRPARQIDKDTGKPKPLTRKQQEAKLHARRSKFVLGLVCTWLQKIFQANKHEIVTDLVKANPDLALHVAAAFGLPRGLDYRGASPDPWGVMRKIDTKNLEPSIKVLCWMPDIWVKRLNCHDLDATALALKELERLHELLPMIPLNDFAAAAEAEIPEPKSWSK